MYEKPSSCSICKSESVNFWNSKNNYNIFRCKYCGFGFVYPSLALADIQKIYAQSGHGSKFTETTIEDVLKNEEIYPNSTIDSNRLANQIVAHHSMSKRALDVGAGYGFFSKELIKKGFAVTALELANNERRIFEQITGQEPINSTFEAFADKEAYGVILMSQILEHAGDPAAWAQKTNQMLEKGGIWMIAVPHFNSFTRRVMQDREFYIIPPEHLNYFTNKSLTILLENYGFEVLEIETTSRLPWHKIPIPGIRYFGRPFLKIVDALGMGMMLNIIARKK